MGGEVSSRIYFKLKSGNRLTRGESIDFPGTSSTGRETG